MEGFLSLFAPAGLIAVVIASSVKIGRYIDTYITPQARASFSLFLLSGKLNKQLQFFPTGTFKLFGQVFGQKHFSIKCLLRSCLFTIISIGIAFALAVIHGESWRRSIFYLPKKNTMGLLVFEALIPAALLVDFLNLYKTRLIMRWLNKTPPPRAYLVLAVLAIDLIAYYAIFCFSIMALFFAIPVAGVLNHLGGSFAHWSSGYAVFILGQMADVFWAGLHSLLRDNLGRLISVINGSDSDPDERRYSLVFIASLAPSVWIWMWLSATATVRASAHSLPVFGFLRDILPFETKPGESVGIIAGLLTSCAIAVFYLVSLWVH